MTTLLKQERQVPSGFILPLDEVMHRVVIDAIDKCGGNYLLAAKMWHREDNHLSVGPNLLPRASQGSATALQAATPSGDGDGSKAPARDPLQPENQSVRPTPPGRRRSA